jgi:hypothetical protein
VPLVAAAAEPSLRLFLGDDEAQISTSISTTEVIVNNVDSSGVWRKWDQHQKVQTFKIDAAHIFSRSMASWSNVTGHAKNTAMIKPTQGLSDVAVSVGYEVLPEWNYSAWRPKGNFIYATDCYRRDSSKFESEVGGLDSRGNGFWALGLGTLLTKTFVNWDAYSTIELHASRTQDIQTTSFQGNVKPGYGGNLGIGLGYNVTDYRMGSAVTWTYEDPIDTESNLGIIQKGSVERYATAVVSLSYLANDQWSGTVSYSDQTLIGSPLNTSLGRGVAVQLQRRWGR